MSTNATSCWLRVRDAAQHIGLSCATLNKMRHYGTGPRYYKRARIIFYDIQDLDAWVRVNSYSSTSQYPVKPNSTAALPEKPEPKDKRRTKHLSAPAKSIQDAAA